MTEKPLELFRYGSFAKHRLEQLRQVLLDSQLYFSSPLKFNDPFEGRVRFVLPAPADTEGWRRYARDQYFCSSLGLSMEGSDTDRVAWLMANQTSLSAHLSKPNLRREYLGGVWACCFAESPTNLLMWSHYADMHRGYCLRFTPQPDDRLFRSIEQVVYDDELPVVVMGETGEITGRAALLRKSTCWSYEREWRAISLEHEGLHALESKQLTGLIFGLDCSVQHQDIVRDWNAERLSPVQLWKVSRHNDEYGLVLTELT